jgi:hypothetical protein
LKCPSIRTPSEGSFMPRHFDHRFRRTQELCLSSERILKSQFFCDQLIRGTPVVVITSNCQGHSLNPKPQGTIKACQSPRRAVKIGQVRAANG